MEGLRFISWNILKVIHVLNVVGLNGRVFFSMT